MINVLLFLWLASAILVIIEKRFIRTIIFISVFSLITSLCFLFFAAPDVAMAEAVIGVFSTIVFIVAFEKFYSYKEVSAKDNETKSKRTPLKKYAPSAIFALILFVLFLFFIPDNPADPYLKNQYLLMFKQDVGGENAVTAIYLGYRLYDTLFEALMLLVSIIAIVHLSWYSGESDFLGKHIDVYKSSIADTTIRIICPVLILFGFIIIMNGHISPGGGFQGGIIAASFFICKYVIFNIYEKPVSSVINLEKILYLGIIVLILTFIVFIAGVYFPGYENLYLTFKNILIGLKVVCGFVIIFYRFIVFERW